MNKRIVLIVLGVISLTVVLTACVRPLSSPVDVKSNEGLQKQISSLLPQGAMLRDFALVPDTQNVLVIYIKDPVIDPQPIPDDLLTCPGNVNGQSITGTYHLALFERDTFVNDLIIPMDEDGMIFQHIGVVFRHTKAVIHSRFGGSQPRSNWDAQQFAEVKLLRLRDLNGDGLPNEFQLEVYVAGCGHVQVLTAGFSAKQQKAVVYPIVEEEGSAPSYWHDNFYPDEQGAVHWQFPCGDHANYIDTQETLEFDQVKEAYVLTSHSETNCEW